MMKKSHLGQPIYNGGLPYMCRICIYCLRDILSLAGLEPDPCFGGSPSTFKSKGGRGVSINKREEEKEKNLVNKKKE